MKRRLPRLVLVAAFAALLASCAGTSTPAPRSERQAQIGSSPETAIILGDASNETEGVKAEHAWTARNLPGWRWETQSLMHNSNGRTYDLIELSKGGETKKIYFDITDWFGKME